MNEKFFPESPAELEPQSPKTPPELGGADVEFLGWADVTKPFSTLPPPEEISRLAARRELIERALKATQETDGTLS